ncbi:hypothetical protein VDGL01_07361 [Verticillium dahliae]
MPERLCPVALRQQLLGTHSSAFEHSLSLRVGRFPFPLAHVTSSKETKTLPFLSLTTSTAHCTPASWHGTRPQLGCLSVIAPRRHAQAPHRGDYRPPVLVSLENLSISFERPKQQQQQQQHQQERGQARPGLLGPILPAWPWGQLVIEYRSPCRHWTSNLDDGYGYGSDGQSSKIDVHNGNGQCDGRTGSTIMGAPSAPASSSKQAASSSTARPRPPPLAWPEHCQQPHWPPGGASAPNTYPTWHIDSLTS